MSTKQLDLYQRKDVNESDIETFMPLSVHLNDLRNKIIISLIVLCITIFIGFSFSREIVKLLTGIAPPGTVFLQIRPGEFFFTSLRTALFAGIVLAAPVIVWQLGSFILPGLTKKEKNIAVPILMAAPFLFFTGMIFAYFFAVPSMLNFLFGFGKDIISTNISIESFVSFTLMIMAICGCTFLLPIIILALANTGIVNSQILLKNWRYVLLSSVISGALLTPTPDPFNMGIVSGILIMLYFISIGILKIMRL
ncbi:MAG: twin arginine-targeting protein translocase TatC [Candidatus Melainabacteria bacterium RIFCSPLOWO2_02_FULL_35_15]|nr:MAG: twin arginine-targeting protein translocase TatC [Candidatus Melainabacteria bacterium RIFCSPLOWO2_12_FULL_35_11]OGI13820.1 MAG: twin arginine-targeting protein translocase TatC [Candidatus Melainabacteria bacterium RIFCSPLOWO2_02_FULL_35_15]